MNKETNEENRENDIRVEADDSLDDSVIAEENAAEALKKLRERLALCHKERQEYLAGWQRAKADFINAKKREEEERGEFAKFSRKELIKELLPALDSFHTAFGNKNAWEKVDLNWRMGVQHIYAQLRGVLERAGVSVIEPKVGEPFNTERHESVATVHTSDQSQNHAVVEVLQKGYSLHGKIIQPAKVKVGEYKNP